MYLGKLTVSDFTRSAGDLWQGLQGRFEAAHGYGPEESEVRSWRRSLPALAEVLSGAPESIQDCLVYLEYEMPGSSSRADVVIAGFDADGHRSAVVIELKQWDASSVAVDNGLVRVGSGTRPHPSDQAFGYGKFLGELSEAFADAPKTLRSCAYLHNTRSHSLQDLKQHPFAGLTETSPLFAADQKDRMVEWISDVLLRPPDPDYVAALDRGALKVSKNLFATVAQAVREEAAWTLLDEQRAAYRQILNLVFSRDGERHLVLVTGGPGTGKSVIAMQLMGELSRRGIPTAHATNSSSFTTVMRSLVQRKGDTRWDARAVKGLFRLSHDWVKRKDRFEVVVCDEAHRFRRRTTLGHLKSDRPQAEEIMENARIVVAFIDERQMLRGAEEGTVDYFRRCAARAGVPPENVHGPIELTAQFRAAGNRDFVEALDTALYEEVPAGFSHRDFAVHVNGSVEGLEAHLQDKVDDGHSARLLAGFCWEWSDPNRDGTLVDDVRVGRHWSRAWNRKAVNGPYSPDRHPYTLWANREEDQLGEVGCIYSVQGFEFDHVGVIWGPDLVWRDGKWVARPEKSFDPGINGRNGPIPEKKALPLLKNAYRVLCSRAMMGCSICCLDEETVEYLWQALGEPLRFQRRVPSDR